MDKAGSLTRAAARIKAEIRPNRGNVGGVGSAGRFNLASPAEDRTGFVKLSVMLPPELYEAVMREATRRAAEDAPRKPEDRRENHRLSDVIRDALTVYLTSLDEEVESAGLP
ncbi:MAG: hypothetical protein HY788_04315 [Deltaproteobacteria bacterium]|nr:hypothetical protein [Deltaproteobacteria bacterium]